MLRPDGRHRHLRQAKERRAAAPASSCHEGRRHRRHQPLGAADWYRGFARSLGGPGEIVSRAAIMASLPCLAIMIFVPCFDSITVLRGELSAAKLPRR
jgi:hypothetical protein